MSREQEVFHPFLNFKLVVGIIILVPTTLFWFVCAEEKRKQVLCVVGVN
jgi:hypothetical protein